MIQALAGLLAWGSVVPTVVSTVLFVRSVNHRDPVMFRLAVIVFAVSCALTALALSLNGNVLWSSVSAFSAGVLLWFWWGGRGPRDRAKRSLGAKSRARLAALARKARQAARPRPVLRPAPGGAR